MTVRIARFAGLVAATAIVSFAAAAQAQPSVRVGDLNLATVAGKAAFAHRVELAAGEVCGGDRNFSIRGACKAAVRDEVTDKLAAMDPATLFAGQAVGHAGRAVRIADLDMATSAGQAAFAQRVNHAAAQVCRGERDLTMQHACQIGVRVEIGEKLAAATPSTRLAAR